MLEIKGLSKSFGKKHVLDDLSFSLQPGKIYGLVGVNGAGKSTLMKIMVGLAFPDSGEVLLDGKPLLESSCPIGFTIEEPCFYPNLSGRDNLLLIAELCGGKAKERVDRALSEVGLSQRGKDAYKTYSLGMKQRLYFALSLLNDPWVLILDEPFSGVDPLTTVAFEKILKGYAEKGAYILVSSHDIRELQYLADGAFIMKGGKIAYQTENAKNEDLFKEFLRSEGGEEGLTLP